ncbi:MAG TPA: hypothetical protein VMV57_07670 [Terracidiphilus sp.]|nr:hypothetical protein [Terracidiphilus sp.]
MSLAAGMLVAAAPMVAEAPVQAGHGEAVVTVMPKKAHEGHVKILPEDLQVKVNGARSSVTGWEPLRGASGALEVVVLIDGSARADLGAQLGDMANFLHGLPADAKAGVAYMENGRAVMQGPLSSDHAAVAKGLRLPSGIPGSSASPYFCLSELANHWPSKDMTARREVVMITNGVDNYGTPGDMNDPYVNASIRDAVKAGLVVYSIYWNNRGFMSGGGGALLGQSLMQQVTDATGGATYAIGSMNPVSMQPYFEDIALRLANQYRLSFDSGLKGKPEVKTMALRVGGPAAKVVAPNQVYVRRVAE